MYIKRNSISLVALFCVFLCAYAQVSAQVSAPLDSSFERGNFFSTRFAKQFRVYQLNTAANGEIDLERFNLTARGSTESVIFKQEENSIRDEADLGVKINYNLFERNAFSSGYIYSVGAASEQNAYYSTDSRTGGLSDLRRVNGALGANARIRDSVTGAEIFNASLLVGGEQNRLMNLSSSGRMLDAQANLNNLKLGGWGLSANAGYEDLQLNLNRKNLDAVVGARLAGQEGEGNDLVFYFTRSARRRDFIAGGGQGPLDSIIIEKGETADSRAGADAKFQLFEGFPSRVSLNYSSEKINKAYNRSDVRNSLTAADRELNREEFTITYQGSLDLKPAILNLSLNYGSRDETNFLKNSRKLDVVTFNKLNELEKQKDNSTSRLDLLSSAETALGQNSSVKLQYLVGILRYNTPSQSNADDRDEFSSSVRLVLTRRQSEYLTLYLSGEAIANHRVYLKASRSSGNYWRRIYRFAPSASLTYPCFTYNASFEVMANYTAYDFETGAGQARSDSYRMLGWRDSVKIDLGKEFAFNLSNSLQYSERGRLYWKDYAESPQANELMYFTRGMISEQIWENGTIGLGARYFKLLQGSFTDYSKLKTKTTHSVQTISPETMITLLFSSKTIISISGWLDMIYDAKGKMTTNPTLLINTVIYL